MMQSVGPKIGGIALDTLDGVSVFGVYKINDLYVAHEINVHYLS